MDSQGLLFCRLPAGLMTSVCSVAVSVVCALADQFLESGACCVYSRIVFLYSKNGRSVRLGCFVEKVSCLSR